MTQIRGIRGATTIKENSAEAIRNATRILLDEVIAENQIAADDVASVLLTMTPDLTATFPAQAIRSRSGWQWVPLMCAQELNVPGGLAKCIRILIHVNTDKTQTEIVHVYQGEAIVLRPDLIRE
jgi:chorismate mutase